MKLSKSLSEYQQELRQSKKEYDKLCKKLKKAKSSYQVEILREDIEDMRQDIVELQLIIEDLKQQQEFDDYNSEQLAY